MQSLKEIYEQVKDAWSDENLFYERLEICKQCEHYSGDTTRTCTECMCWLPIKLHIKHAHCKIGKW